MNTIELHNGFSAESIDNTQTDQRRRLSMVRDLRQILINQCRDKASNSHSSSDRTYWLMKARTIESKQNFVMGA